MLSMKIFNRISNQKGQIGDIITFFVFFSFVIYFVMTFTSMQIFFKAQQIVDEIVRSEVEIVRTKGMFTSDEYKDFMTKLSKYGQFDVYITVDKLEDNSSKRAKLFTKESILDRPLRIGDFVNIFVESKKPSLFAVLMNRNFMFGSTSHQSGQQFRMQSLCSGMVCVDGYVRGVEVVNIINKYAKINGINIELYTFDYGNNTTALTPVPDYYGIGNIEYYDPAEHTEGTNGWIDYEGRFRVDIDRDPDHNYEVSSVTIEQLL